jgi:CubicO group peptidase (beta-lactamase class C family)
MLIRAVVTAMLLLATRSLLAGDAEKKIDELVLREMAQQKIPGVAIGILKDGKVAKAQGYGFANVELQVPVTANTMFQSGSLGKQITATAVMMLVEEGKLSLSDPVTKFFSDAPPSWKAITIEHLLTHTSGIPNYGKDSVNYRKDYTEEDLVRLAYSRKLEFAPGSDWNYSNTGYILLGVIIHRVTGRPYWEMIEERIFQPLKMTTARIISEADIVPNRAAGYRIDNGQLNNQEWIAPSLNTTADGSLYVSVKDLLLWAAAVRSRSLLKQSSWELIFKPTKLKNGQSFPYGFGWFLDSRNGHVVRYHSGSWQGFRSHIVVFEKDDISIVVLVNLAKANPENIANGIAEILIPQLISPKSIKQ